MTATVTEIWRHPIKSHGREPLESVTLEAGKALPLDRLWAVAHERCGRRVRLGQLRPFLPGCENSGADGDYDRA